MSMVIVPTGFACLKAAAHLRPLVPCTHSDIGIGTGAVGEPAAKL